MTQADDPKAEARRAAQARRRAVHDPARSARAAALLLEELRPHAGRVISGYMPIRTEVSPLPAMEAMARLCRICVPVIEGPARPLVFREWRPGCEMVDGPFGARVPAEGEVLEPDVLIVPLLAFDRQGGRLGYGGGFYDRTLEVLRARRPVLAIGFAYAGQEADALPIEPTDQPLDMIVTDEGVLRFG